MSARCFALAQGRRIDFVPNGGEIPIVRSGERASLGYVEIRVIRIIHAETVVMLGSEYHIFDARILEHQSPLLTIEIHRIELFAEPPVPCCTAPTIPLFQVRNKYPRSGEHRI